MLNEIINAIGKKEIIDKQSDAISHNNCIYIKIPIDNNKDYNIQYIDKGIEMKNLALINWCKAREIYSLNINSNKNIMQQGFFSKVILSCVPYSVIFKYNTFMNKEYLKKHSIIDGFYIMIKEYLTILNFEQYIHFYSDIFNNISNNVIQIIEQQSKNKQENLKIKMFLDVPVETYKKEYDKYLTSKIFTGAAIKLDDEQKGRGSFFYNLNPDKPLLSYLNNFKEIHLLSLNEAKFQLQLNRYLNWHNEQTIQNGLQSIKYKTNNNNGLCVIEDFNIDPYQRQENNIYFNIDNIINLPKFKGKIVDSQKILNQYFHIITNKDTIVSQNNDYNFQLMIGRKLNILLKKYNHIFDKNANIKKYLLDIFDSFIEELYCIYFYSDNIYNTTSLINFEICTKDWLFKTQEKEKIMQLIEEIRNKIIYDEIYNIKSDQEFLILCGTLASYFKLKAPKSEKTHKLFRDYLYAKDVKRILVLLSKDQIKLDYNGTVHSRSDKIMCALDVYCSINDENNIKLDKKYFRIGLFYPKNLIYSKIEEGDYNNDEK